MDRRWKLLFIFLIICFLCVKQLQSCAPVVGKDTNDPFGIGKLLLSNTTNEDISEIILGCLDGDEELRNTVAVIYLSSAGQMLSMIDRSNVELVARYSEESLLFFSNKIASCAASSQGAARAIPETSFKEIVFHVGVVLWSRSPALLKNLGYLYETCGWHNAAGEIYHWCKHKTGDVGCAIHAAFLVPLLFRTEQQALVGYVRLLSRAHELAMELVALRLGVSLSDYPSNEDDACTDSELPLIGAISTVHNSTKVNRSAASLLVGSSCSFRQDIRPPFLRADQAIASMDAESLANTLRVIPTNPQYMGFSANIVAQLFSDILNVAYAQNIRSADELSSEIRHHRGIGTGTGSAGPPPPPPLSSRSRPSDEMIRVGLVSGMVHVMSCQSSVWKLQ
jgi:hypothetical protein